MVPFVMQRFDSLMRNARRSVPSSVFRNENLLVKSLHLQISEVGLRDVRNNLGHKVKKLNLSHRCYDYYG